MTGRWIVFDAMGVLYRHGDDVTELLIPYARQHGSAATPQRIRELYGQARLGAMSSAQLWEGLGIAEGASDEDYCRLHELTEGVSDFLASDHRAGLACLSNDVSEWSAALRRRFGIEDAFEVWLISGDLGGKKPDGEIYEVAAQRLGADGNAVLFVDDRPANLDVAAERGWLTVQFGGEPSDHRSIQSFAELPPLISAWS